MTLCGVEEIMADDLLARYGETTSSKPEPNGDGRHIEPLAGAVGAAEVEDLARQLLLPNPETLTATGQMLVVPVVSKPGPLEFFRTHPKLRLTLKMVTPNKGEIGAHTYAVAPAMEGILARYRFEPFIVTLYPIVIDSKPLVYKLVSVKPPADGRDWDNWNLSKKLALDMAVNKWIALRSIRGAYEACEPDPAAQFPDPMFPDWSESEWLHKSLAVTDLIIRDENHSIFKEIRHL
jgi:hypothetical protein